jgi:hypothetical protein
MDPGGNMEILEEGKLQLLSRVEAQTVPELSY